MGGEYTNTKRNNSVDICGSGFGRLLGTMGWPSETLRPRDYAGCLQKVSVVEMLRTSRLVNQKS